jgi:TBC1 domain family member 5
LSKAVIGAMGEVKRNVNYLQSASNSPQATGTSLVPSEPTKTNTDADVEHLSRRIQELENRNKALAKMLDDALQSLRTCKLDKANEGNNEDIYNISLAKVQFVSVYMADPEIPIPGVDLQLHGSRSNQSADAVPKSKVQEETTKEETDEITENDKSTVMMTELSVEDEKRPSRQQDPRNAADAASQPKKAFRPSLAESSFSFMLGENRHRSSFVSSVSDLPEQRRDSESKTRSKHLWAERDKQDRKESESEDDGFTLNSLYGGQKRQGYSR